MTPKSTALKNSTTVRFIIAVSTALLVTGCGTVAPLSSQTQQFRTAGPALCENFGPELRCSNSDRSRVSRELERANLSTQLGLRGW